MDELGRFGLEERVAIVAGGSRRQNSIDSMSSPNVSSHSSDGADDSARSSAACTAGSNSAINMPMIVMTTSSSTRVKARGASLP